MVKGDNVTWCPFCRLYNPACSIFYVIVFFATDASLSWDELEVNWDERGHPDAEGRTALVFFFPGEGMDISSVNTSNITAHYLSILTSVQKFWTFSFTSYF